MCIRDRCWVCLDSGEVKYRTGAQLAADIGAVTGGPYLPLAGGTMAGDIILPDNIKLEVGSAAGGDLQIYHDAANSYIDEQGTGDLFIKGSTNVYISTSGGGTMAQFTDSGSVFLNHSGSLRFSTSAIGVTAYGDVTTTGQFRVNALNTAPASASATGTLGEIRFTADHIYVCVAANTWKRVAIATF